MRDIKFRVYDKEEDVMYQNGSFTLEILGKFNSVYVKDKPYIRELINYGIMQYTGVKDKNGKEIYEGDIVKYFARGNAIIKFKKGAFAIESKSEIDYMCKLYGEIEVIGNIYENEDLLEK